VAQGSFVRLHFNDFELEQTTACVADQLEIWFDNEINEVPDKILCGVGVEPDIQSNINFMTLQFKTDKSIEFKGFDLTYTTVSTLGIINPCSPNPCKNGSKCAPDDKSSNGFVCQCENGFAGKLCETNLIN